MREDESDGRSFFSVTFLRLRRTDDGWRSTGSDGMNPRVDQRSTLQASPP